MKIDLNASKNCLSELKYGETFYSKGCYFMKIDIKREINESNCVNLENGIVTSFPSDLLVEKINLKIVKNF